MIRINVTIICRDQATALPATIEAVLEQDYPAVTITVVDNGSIDATWETAASYSAPGLCCLRLAEPVSLAEARNLALLCSRCDAITFHEPGEVAAADKLSTQARLLSRVTLRGAAQLALSGLLLLCPSGEVRALTAPDGGRVASVGAMRALYRRTLYSSGLWRMGLFERLGGFRQRGDPLMDMIARVDANRFSTRWTREIKLAKLLAYTAPIVAPLDLGAECASRRGEPAPITLPDSVVTEITSPEILTVNWNIPASQNTLEMVCDSVFRRSSARGQRYSSASSIDRWLRLDSADSRARQMRLVQPRAGAQ